MSVVPNPHVNHLLGAFPPDVNDRILADLEPVMMRRGQILQEPTRSLQYAYFPTTAICSLHHSLQDGTAVELAGIGNEGMVGVNVFLGGDSTAPPTSVQVGGHGYRLEACVLRQEFRRGGALRARLLRYSQALILQRAQTAACYRRHSVEQQLCRWLLVTLDRVGSSNLVVTETQLSMVLGARRDVISEATGVLQRNGLISDRGGQLTVLRREGLMARSCECYSIVAAEIACLLPTLAPRAPDARLDPALVAGAAPSILADQRSSSAPAESLVAMQGC
jgi:hypothetical protein